MPRVIFKNFANAISADHNSSANPRNPRCTDCSAQNSRDYVFPVRNRDSEGNAPNRVAHYLGLVSLQLEHCLPYRRTFCSHNKSQGESRSEVTACTPTPRNWAINLSGCGLLFYLVMSCWATRKYRVVDMGKSRGNYWQGVTNHSWQFPTNHVIAVSLGGSD